MKQHEEGLLCDNCAVWHHIKCEKVDEELYEVMKKQKNMLWFCSVCNPKVRKSLKELEKVKDENTEMKKELNSLKKENGVMAKKVEELEEKWTERENRGEEEQTDLKAELNKWEKKKKLKKNNAKWKDFEKFEERMKERGGGVGEKSN